MMCFKAFDKAADHDASDHPIQNFHMLILPGKFWFIILIPCRCSLVCNTWDCLDSCVDLDCEHVWHMGWVPHHAFSLNFLINVVYIIYTSDFEGRNFNLYELLLIKTRKFKNLPCSLRPHMKIKQNILYFFVSTLNTYSICLEPKP